MKNKETLTLTLSPDADYLPLSRSYVQEAAKKCGLSEKDTDEIILATNEAVTNVIKHAFLPQQQATFDIVCEMSSLGLKVIVRDKGYPFAPERVEEYSIDKVKAGKKPIGLGFFIMKQSVDEFSFHNMGAGGKEIQLVKYLHKKHIEDYLDESELASYEKEIEKPQKTIEKIPYRIELLNVGNAIEISQCAYRTYGYNYIHDFIYYPERIAEMNNRGELISSVAVNETTNEIMSHAAIEVTEGKDLVELGVAFTKPQFRHQGCFNNICEFLMGVAKDESIKGVYATAVTIHPFSQKAILKNNFKESGILIGLGPASTFKDSLEHGQQRESMVILFRLIEQLPEQILYAPSHHKKILEKIYANIGIPVKWQDNPKVKLKELSGKHAAIDVKVHSQMEEADIYVNECGADIVEEVIHRLRELIREKIQAIYLHLNLRDPYTAHLVSYFEKKGFFFSGVLPCGLKQNIILQFIDAKIDYNKIQTASEFTAELLSYVKKCAEKS